MFSSIPEEVFLEIIHCVPLTITLNESQLGQGIRFANGQVSDLSRVNHQLRRLCLPFLYNHLVVVLTEAGLPPGATHAAELDTLRRIMEDKPLLASLVRRIEINPQPHVLRYCVFDSLPLFPNITRIDFPPNVKLDMRFLSIINSCTSGFSARWNTTESFFLTTMLPPGALSRVRTATEYLTPNLWHYFSTCGLGVQSLTLPHSSPSGSFDLTYPGLSKINVTVTPGLISHNPELAWTSFLERHPQLTDITITFERLERLQIWVALKHFPVLRSLCDTVYRQRLSPSFSFEYIFAEREAPISDTQFAIIGTMVNVDASAILESIHCLGSSLPVLPSLGLRFCEASSRSFTVTADDFVSVIHGQLRHTASLTLTNAMRWLDLDSLSYDGEISIATEFALKRDLVNGDVYGNRDKNQTKRMAQLVWLFASGIPLLQYVEFRELEDDNLWNFLVLRDGQQTRITLGAQYI